MEVLEQEIKIEQYSEYKDSKVDWLGNIPKHWNIFSLGSLMELKSDKNHPDLEVLSVYRDYGVIRKSSRDDNHNATSSDTSNYKAVNPGDLVVNKMKAWQGSMGISSYKGIVSPAYITCKVENKNINSDFLHQLLRSHIYIGEYNRISYGVRVGQWDMHYEDFKKVPVLLPPVKEQNQIAQFLDKKTNLIDQTIAQKEQLIDVLKERRKILIHQSVTRGLNREVEMKDSGVEWIGKIPKHWDIKRSKYIFTEVNERSENGKEELLSVSHMTGVTPRSEKNVYMFKAEDYSGSKLCKKGDLVINTMWAWMGALGISDRLGIVSPSYGVYRQKNPDFFNSWFLENLLRGENYIAEYNRISTGLHKSRLRLYPPMFLNLEMILPPKEEQDMIEKKMQIILKKVDSSIEKIKLQIQKLKEYKTTLINAAVTGKIKISEHAK